MTRKIFALIICASLISAGLLFIGTTVLANFSPSLRSSLDALVAGKDVQAASSPVTAEEKVPSKVDLSSEARMPEASITAKATLASSTGSAPPLKMSVSSDSNAAPITGVTIAQLLGSPQQYSGKVLTLTGIATSLSHDKFLLNDGTGQILIELDDDPGKYVVVTGVSITITAKLDSFSSPASAVLEACTVTDQNGTFELDDCDDSDDDEDMDDSDDDDSLGDNDDDTDEDDSLDDSDDDSGEGDSLDDGEDDSDDDNEKDSSGDDSDDDEKDD